MAGEVAPTDYYPNQGSFAERYMRTRDAARYATEGSKAYEGGGISPPPAPAASYSSWWADDLTVGSSMLLPGSSGDYSSVPDEAALDTAGDIDIRCAVSLDDWTPLADNALVSKWGSSGQLSYLIRLRSNGRLNFVHSADGTSEIASQTNVPPTVSDGELLLVKVTLDVDNGSGGHDKTFYTKTSTPPDAAADLDLDTGWTQLGNVETTAGVTSIFNSTSEVEQGSNTSGTERNASGRFYAAIIKDGIDGTTVLNIDFTTQTVGATSFTATSGQTVTVNGNAELVSATSLWAPRNDGLGYGNLVQATAAKQPTFTPVNAAFNGRSTVDGDGVDDTMVSMSSGAATQPITIVMVMRNSNASTSTNSAVGHNATTEPRAMFRSNQKDGIYAGTILQESTVQAARLGVNLYYATFNGATSSLERNGTVIVSGDAGTNDISSALNLMTVTTQYTPSENAFIMVVDGDLTSPEKIDLETWVTDTYGTVIA
jgi:hypothetical protein